MYTYIFYTMVRMAFFISVFMTFQDRVTYLQLMLCMHVHAINNISRGHMLWFVLFSYLSTTFHTKKLAISLTSVVS